MTWRVTSFVLSFWIWGFRRRSLSICSSFCANRFVVSLLVARCVAAAGTARAEVRPPPSPGPSSMSWLSASGILKSTSRGVDRLSLLPMLGAVPSDIDGDEAALCVGHCSQRDTISLWSFHTAGTHYYSSSPSHFQVPWDGVYFSCVHPSPVCVVCNVAEYTFLFSVHGENFRKVLPYPMVLRSWSNWGLGLLRSWSLDLDLIAQWGNQALRMVLKLSCSATCRIWIAMFVVQPI